MIFRNHDEFDDNMYTYGKKALQDKDNLRTMNYQKTFDKILNFIEQ